MSNDRSTPMSIHLYVNIILYNSRWYSFILDTLLTLLWTYSLSSVVPSEFYPGTSDGALDSFVFLNNIFPLSIILFIRPTFCVLYFSVLSCGLRKLLDLRRVALTISLTHLPPNIFVTLYFDLPVPLV